MKILQFLILRLANRKSLPYFIPSLISHETIFILLIYTKYQDVGLSVSHPLILFQEVYLLRHDPTCAIKPADLELLTSPFYYQQLK